MSKKRCLESLQVCPFTHKDWMIQAENSAGNSPLRWFKSKWSWVKDGVKKLGNLPLILALLAEKAFKEDASFKLTGIMSINE